MSITVTVTGEEGVVATLQARADEIETKVQAVVTKYALKIEEKVKKKIAQAPATGRVYTRGEGITHQASAPGEPPASDTGRLVSNIRHVLMGMAAKVIADTEYAAALAFGTDTIQPRPFMKPVLDEIRDDFIRDLRAALT